MRQRLGQRRIGHQRRDQRARARRRGVVGRILRPAHQLLGVVGGVEEPTVAVAEVRQRDVEQLAGRRQPARVGGRLVQDQQPVGQVAVVVGHAGRVADPAVARGPPQPPVDDVDVEQQLGASRAASR